MLYLHVDLHAPGADFGILSVPSRWAADTAQLSAKLQHLAAALLAVVQDDSKPLSLLLASGGTAQGFFVNKEELSQVGRSSI